MEQKDLYKILELDKTATEQQIKANYKRLALKYHPDRQGGKSESEKKAAEEKFKEIGFAYSILSDPEKKQRYDQFGITDDQQQMGNGFDPSEIFKHFMGGFGSMFGDDDDSPFGSFFGRGRQQQRGPQKGQSIRMQIGVSIEEICKGVHRDIEYDIKAKCSKCGGKGGEGVETCPHCHGTGMITETQRHGFSIIQNSHPCQYCGGTGQTIKSKCKNCNGTGFEIKTVKVKVDIPGGFDNGHQMMFNGKGYESKDGGPTGDLLLDFIYQYDTTKYSIQGNTIYEIIEIPYYNCILGCEKEVTLPTNEKIKIKVPEYSKDNTLVMTNKRFGKMNYCYVVRVKMPTYIRDKEKDLLKQIQKENH